MDGKQFKQYMKTQEDIAKSLATIAGALVSIDRRQRRQGGDPPLSMPEHIEDALRANLGGDQAEGQSIFEPANNIATGGRGSNPLAKGIDGMQ